MTSIIKELWLGNTAIGWSHQLKENERAARIYVKAS